MIPQNSHAFPVVGSKRSPDSSSDRENGQWTPDDSDLEGSHPDTSRKRMKKEHESGRPVSVSCETCKLRKVKCDRGQPSCSWCVKNRQVCEYRERKKPGLRAGYGRELEAKLAEQAKVLNRIQETLLRHESAIAQLSNRNVPTAPSPRSTEGSIVQVQLGTLSRPEVGKDSTQLPSISNYLFGIKSHTSSYGNSPHFQNNRPATLHEKRASTPLDDFPDQDLCHSLCELYFTHINPWLPVFQREYTLRLLFKSAPSRLDPPYQMILHAIIAVSLRFLPDRRMSSEAKHRQYRHSIERVQLYCLRSISIEAIQALSIITLDLIGGQNDPTACNIVTLLTRSAIQLGLTREPRTSGVRDSDRTVHSMTGKKFPEARDFVEVETQRRLMWAIYILDRYYSVATSMYFTLTDSVERTLPCNDDYFLANRLVDTPLLKTEVLNEYPGAHSLGTFSYFIELVDIISRVQELSKIPLGAKSPDDVSKWRFNHGKLEELFNAWWLRLPLHYRNISSDSHSRQDVDPSLVLLQASYFMTLIRLHSYQAFPVQTSALLTPNLNAANLCVSAAESIVQLLDLARSLDVLSKIGPFFAVPLWTAGRTFIVHSAIIHRGGQTSPIAFQRSFGSKSTSQPATPTHRSLHDYSSSASFETQLYDLVNGLRALGEYWPMASRYAELLTRSRDNLHISEAAETILVLKDMNRSASDVEAVLSRRFTIQVSRGSSPSRPTSTARLNASGGNESQMGDTEYLSDLDMFGYPRLPTGFDKIIDTASSPKVERREHEYGRDASHLRLPSIQTERRSEWVSQHVDAR